MDNVEKKPVEHEEEPSHEKNHYVYVDNSTNQHAIVFECVAKDILEADENYKKAMGKDVSQQMYIGCRIEPVKNYEGK